MLVTWLALALSCVGADHLVQNREQPETLLYVQTVPADAEIQLHGKVVGRSPALFPCEAGERKITLKRDGFQPEEKLITVAEGRVTRLEVALNAAGANPVVEGVGWGVFRPGATREEITKAVGPPDANPIPNSQWVCWKSQHVDCLFGSKGGATEVRFNRGFSEALTSGIKIGSSEKEVLAAYGNPDRVVNKPQSKMLEYGKRGVLMWIIKGKVYDFTVFKPYKTGE